MLTILGKFEWAQVLASLALFVSLLNSYFSFFKKGKLQSRFGDVMFLQTDERGRLHITPEIAIHNPGAALAIIHEMTFQLVRVRDDHSEQLIWRENLTTVFDDERRTRDTRFDSYPGILFIPGGEALSKRLDLVTMHSLPLSDGDYELVAMIRSDGTSPKFLGVKTKIRVSNTDIFFLEQNRLSGQAANPERLTLYYRRGENTNCFMSPQPVG